MDILGEDSFGVHEPPDLITALTRRAWSLLQTFGEEAFDTLEVGVSPETEGESQVYESTCTQTFRSTDAEFQVCIDQFPFIEGDAVSDIGFVALHIDKLNNLEMPEESQQLIFQLETHLEGERIFAADRFGHELETIEELSDLLKIAGFLDSLDSVIWPQYLSDGFAKINSTPESELARKAMAHIFNETDADD